MNSKYQDSLILILILLISPLTGAGIDIFTPSLPSITTYFNTQPEFVSLSITVYIISYGVFQVIFGSLSDSFGRKKILIYSMSGYVLCSFLIPFSNSIFQLLILRFLQGFFVGGPRVVAKSMLSDRFGGVQLAKYTTYTTIAWAIGAIASPFLGGILETFFGWKGAFYFLFIYGVVVLIVSIKFLVETNKFFTSFALKPILANYILIIQNKQFLGASLIIGIAYSFLTIFSVEGPFLIQNILGYSPIWFGYFSLILGIAWLTGNIICRSFIANKNLPQIILINSLLCLFATLGMLYIALFYQMNIYSLLTPIILVYISAGLTFPYFLGKALAMFPNMAGAASATIGSIFVIFAGLMSGIASMLQTSSQLPMVCIYLALASISFILYLRYIFHLKLK